MYCVMDQIDFEFFCNLLRNNLTYLQISDILKNNYPNIRRGLSVPSIKKFCNKNGLSSRLKQDDVNEMVREAVEEVSVSKFLINIFTSNSSKLQFDCRQAFRISRYSSIFDIHKRPTGHFFVPNQNVLYFSTENDSFKCYFRRSPFSTD